MSSDDERQWLGTANQIDWARQIEARVRAEFDQVAKTLEAVAARQSAQDRLETVTIIAILQEKRLEVLEQNEAGYFIKHWQESTDQVRKLLWADSRYTAIRLAKAARGFTSRKPA